MQIESIKLTSARPTVELAVTWGGCIAKTYVDSNGKRHYGMTVDQHSSATGYIFMELIKQLPLSLRRILPKDAVIIIVCHDVGKISPGFQNKISIEIKEIIFPYCQDHSEVTEAALSQILKSVRIPKMLGAHHGSYHTSVLPADYEVYGGEAWQKARRDFIYAMENRFGKIQTTKLSSRAETLLLYCTSISDWIASDEQHFDQSRTWTDEEIKAQAKLVISQLKGFDKFAIKKNLSFEEMFPGFTPNEMQETFVKTIKGPGVYILEAEPGGGKTEAALWATYVGLTQYKAAGLYFSLPTRLTSNKIHERCSRWMTNIFDDVTAPRLIHGQAWTQPIIGAGQFAPGGRWFSPNRRAMLEKFGVGTIDQALMGALNVRFNYIRLGGLMKKCVIFDEVHSYDAYTGRILQDLIKKLKKLQCIIIILSATLTRGAKARLLDVTESKLSKRGSYPMITYQRKGKLREITLNSAKQKVFDIKYMGRSPMVLQEAINMAKKGANILWVENTVGEAEKTYQMLKSGMSDVPLGIMHSRFLDGRRFAIETEWLNKMGPKSTNRPSGCILVGTQVVEQSVDIDFDMLITAVAPSDFLIQRMGRIWRHSTNNRPSWMTKPTVWILGPNLSLIKDEKIARKAFGSTSSVYELFTIWKSAKIWSRISEITLPAKTRTILEATYSKPLKKEAGWIKDVYQKMESHISVKVKQATDVTSCHLSVRGDNEDDLFGNAESPAVTRKQSVPTQQIIICRDIALTSQMLKLTLYDGGKIVEIPVGELSPEQKKEVRKIAIDINKNMLKVPYLSNNFDDYDNTMSPLGNVVFGNAIAVSINSSGDLAQESGRHTGYKYTEETGCIRIDL